MFRKNQLSRVIVCAKIITLSMWLAFGAAANVYGDVGQPEEQSNSSIFAMAGNAVSDGPLPQAEPEPLPLTLPTVTLVANPSTITVGSMTTVTAFAMHSDAQPAAGITLFYGSSGAGDAGDFEFYPSTVVTDPNGKAIIGWIGGSITGTATIAAMGIIDSLVVYGTTDVNIVYGAQPSLQNGGFEDWIGQVSPAYWANDNGVNITKSTDAHAGSFSAKVETGAIISQIVQVTPGTDYQFGWWTKTGFAGPDIIGYAKNEWLDSSFSSIMPPATQSITAFSNWTKYGPNTFPAPSNAAYAKIIFESTPGYNMLIDDVIWTPSGITMVTIQPGPANGKDSFVRDTLPSSNFGNDPQLFVVDYSSPSTARTYIEFDLSTIPSNAVIVDANLELFYYVFDHSNQPEVGVYQVAYSWNEMTINWSNQPAFSTASEDVRPLGPATNEFVNWNIKNLVQRWVNSTAVNHGVVLKATSELGTSARLFAKFRSSDWGNASERPRLIVSYSEPNLPALPDLIVKSMIQSPGTLPPKVGDPYVYFDIVIKNQGQARANLRNMKLSLYKNNLSNLVGEMQWSSSSTEYLDPGQEKSILNFTTMQNSDLTQSAGNFTVIANVDSGNVIAESNESNNQLSKQITIAAPALPDLIVKSMIQSPGTPPPKVGDPYVYFDIVIKNQGQARANLRNMKLSLYKNNLSNLVGEWLWPPSNTEYLDPSQELTVQVTTMQNSDLTQTPGTFTVIAYVDSGNVIAESNEGNNQLSKPITIAAPPLPDLIVKSMTWSPTTPAVGDPYVYFNIVIKNQGLARANLRNMKLSLYKTNLSNLVGEMTWSSSSTEYLDPGQEKSILNFTTMQNSDLTRTAGTFTVIAYVDSGNVITESNEGNNQLSKQITIVSTLPVPPGPL